MKNCQQAFFYNLSLYIFAYIMMTSAKCFVYLHKQKQDQEQSFNNYYRNQSLCTILEVNNTNIFGTNLLTNNIENYTDSFHVSYLDSMSTRKIFRSYEKENKLIIKPADCLMISNGEHDIEPCSPKYAKTIQNLIKLINTNSAAVISISKKCYRDLATTTYNSLKQAILQNSITTGIQNVLHYKTTDHISPTNLSSIIQDIKLQEISLVVLFTNTEVTSYIFDVAKRFNIAGYNTVWLTVELSHHLIRNEQIPWQVIDVKQSNDAQWNKNVLNETLDVFLNTYEELVSNQTMTKRENYLQLKKTLNERLQKIQCTNENQQIDIYARNPFDTDSLAWVKIFSSSEGENMAVVSDASLLVRMLRVSTSLTTLRVVTVIEPPFTMYANHLFNKNNGKCDHGIVCRRAVQGMPDMNAGKWEHTCCIGMVMDLLLTVANDLHFYADVYVVEDGFYGGYNKNTSEWNGMIEDIRTDEADIAVAPLTPTADRFEVVEFCEPYLRIDLGIMISTLTSDLNFINWEFLNPLDTELRTWIVVTFIIGTILIYLLENQHLALQRILVKGVHPRYSWREGFSYFSGLTFQRDLGGKNPQKYGARVTAVAFAFGMVIIMTTYTAVLTASKVSQESTNPFFGFRDDRVRFPSPDFKYATVHHTSIEAYFKNSQDEVHQRMYHFMKNYNLNQTTDGIELVKAGVLNAFIHEYPVLEHHMSKEGGCNLKIYGDPIPQGGYAFGVRKNSPWKQLISQSILKNKENEVIKNIYDKWFPTACAQNSSATVGFQKVGINYFGGLIFVLGISLIISLALLGGEHFCYSHHRRVINPIQTKVLVWRETKAAGRRNAIIDPDDISRLQQMQEAKKNDGMDDHSDDENSVISEGEEEMIRLRMMTARRQSRSHRLSRCTDTTSVNTRTSSNCSETPAMFFNTSVQYISQEKKRNSISKKSLRSSTLKTTLEVSEPEISEANVSCEHHSDEEYYEINHEYLANRDINIHTSGYLENYDNFANWNKSRTSMSDVNKSETSTPQSLRSADRLSKENQFIHIENRSDDVEKSKSFIDDIQLKSVKSSFVSDNIQNTTIKTSENSCTNEIEDKNITNNDQNDNCYSKDIQNKNTKNDNYYTEIVDTAICSSINNSTISVNYNNKNDYNKNIVNRNSYSDEDTDDKITSKSVNTNYHESISKETINEMPNSKNKNTDITRGKANQTYNEDERVSLERKFSNNSISSITLPHIDTPKTNPKNELDDKEDGELIGFKAILKRKFSPIRNILQRRKSKDRKNSVINNTDQGVDTCSQTDHIEKQLQEKNSNNHFKQPAVITNGLVKRQSTGLANGIVVYVDKNNFNVSENGFISNGTKSMVMNGELPHDEVI